LLALLASAFLLINYPPEYLRRLIAYQVSDVNDYKIFPERAIQPTSHPLPFQPSINPAVDEAHGITSEEWLSLFMDFSNRMDQ
jgi:hypothetical protein